MDVKHCFKLSRVLNNPNFNFEVKPIQKSSQQPSGLKLFGVRIILDEKPEMKVPRYVAPKSQQLPLIYHDFLLVKGVEKERIQLILRKRLTLTDMNKNHGRLSLPRKMIEKSFLMPEEERFIQKDVQSRGNKKRKNKLTVTVVDLFTVATPPYGMRSMKMAKWNYDESTEKKNSWWLALTNDWIKFVQQNQLSAGDAIQIWSFRLEGDLGLIIHKV